MNPALCDGNLLNGVYFSIRYGNGSIELPLLFSGCQPHDSADVARARRTEDWGANEPSFPENADRVPEVLGARAAPLQGHTC